ncbi:hypothetical protein KAU11_03890 [Candidatus Babeliales bacterium]|nr:hypothetical protein [Candidatus Babeliales bacterium]
MFNFVIFILLVAFFFDMIISVSSGAFDRASFDVSFLVLLVLVNGLKVKVNTSEALATKINQSKKDRDD